MRRKSISYAKYGYLFSIPFAAAFLIFMLYPFVYTAVIGFTDLRGLGRTDFKFLEDPFQNFVTILNNKTFRASLQNTFKIWIINFIPQILLALVLTAWFTGRRHKIKGQGVFKVLFYMPNIITAATIAILFNVLFLYPTGPINFLLQKLGVIKQPFYFTTNQLASQLIVAFIQFWTWFGYSMLIFISGVLGLNPEMYEAADIDGASSVQQFFFITLPNLRTIMLFMVITSIVGGLNMFDIPRLFNMGEPGGATTTTSLFIFNQAFSGSYMYNRAAAASMIVFAVIAALSAVVFFLMRDKEAARQKKAERMAKRAAKRAGGAVI